MNYWIFGALVLSLVSPICYSKSIFACKAKPHRVTRLIVWLASVAAFLAVNNSDNTAGKLFAVIFLVRATYLLVVAAIYGVSGTSRLDWSCLVIGSSALAVYALTRSELIAACLGVLTDFVGYVPTFVKTWHQPDSESPMFFALEALASLCGMVAIWQITVDIILPTYFVACGIALVLLIYRKRLATLWLYCRRVSSLQGH